ncbi:MAG: sugar 3,4-ketoisomerase [Betaproteobacteria bacterium]
MESKFLRSGEAWFDGRVSTLTLVRHHDERGILLPLELDSLPFPVRRLFTVVDVPSGTVRGGHGHCRGWQLMICISGAIRLRLRHNRQEVSLMLSDDGPALIVGADVWAEQTYLVANSVLLVACSEVYDPESYFTEVDSLEIVVPPEHKKEQL